MNAPQGSTSVDACGVVGVVLWLRVAAAEEGEDAEDALASLGLTPGGSFTELLLVVVFLAVLLEPHDATPKATRPSTTATLNARTKLRAMRAMLSPLRRSRNFAIDTFS